MREWTDDCVGCPQGCRSCGRKMKYLAIYCDECGEQLNEDEVYEYDRKDYCMSCYDNLMDEIDNRIVYIPQERKKKEVS